MARIGLLLSLLLSVCTFAQSDNSEKKVFDHADTGFLLEGFHDTLNCNDCHRAGQFKGTPKECFDCHAMNGFLDASAKPADHLPTTQDCEACHIPTIWEDILRYDHTQTLGTCSGCHNGASDRAPQKPMDHPATTNNCDSCHSDMAWQPIFFDHDGTSAACQECHEEDRPSSHTGQRAMPTDCDSSSCHDNTSFWK